MELNYDKIFEISILAMRINRSHPDIKRDLKWLIQFIFMNILSTMVFFIIMYNIIFLNLKANDFTQTCKNGTLSVLYVIITFEYCIMLWKQQYLMHLINNMKEDYMLKKRLPLKEQEIIERYAKKGTALCKLWLFLAIMVFGVFLVKNVVLITYYYLIDGEVRMIPLYDLIYPTFIEKNKDSVLIYMFTYSLMFFYGANSSVMMTAFVPLGPSFMLHACGQLEVVEKRIEALFDNDNIEEVANKLKDVVKQLQYIYDFVDRIQLSYRVAYELSLKAGTIVLPITSYEVIESLKNGEVSLEFITFIIGGVLFCSCPCYYSDLLMKKGEDLRLAVYSCRWERSYDRRIRSTVEIILLRALRPIVIRSLFRTVCLEALTDLFQQSYTLFNLMNAVWE